MKKLLLRISTEAIIVLTALTLAAGVSYAQTKPSPVAPQIVREGDFALELSTALKVGDASDEINAENLLGGAGVAPRNGWIADYPVTPDIIGELRDSIIYAAQAKTISMDQDSAIKAFEEVQSSMNLAVGPAAAGPPPGAETQPSTGDTDTGEVIYPDADALAGYYSVEGPPVVTYYAPPPDYLYLYAWVPYPYWWGGIWFGGFFVLNDFHRHFVRNGRSFVVSNHFNDVSAHRVFRVDPVNRARGRTFAGVGAPRANNFIGTGVQRAPERVFNSRSVPRTGSSGSLSSRAPSVRQPAARSLRANPFPQNRVYSQPPGAGRTFTPRSGSSGGSRSFSAPSGVGGRSFSAPSGGGHPGGGGGGGRR